jgi:HSP20 family protein
MAIDLVPTSFWRFPVTRSVWDDDEEMAMMTSPSGISISEDDTHVYVEVALPGVDPKDVDITFDKGTLWVKGEAKEEEQKKKFYRKATSSFSYRIAVPGEIDTNIEPEALSKHGVMTITFTKSKASLPKKISVKA